MAPIYVPSSNGPLVRADLIVFLNPPEAESAAAGVRPTVTAAAAGADDRAALSLDDAEGLDRAGMRLLPDADFALEAAWRGLASKPGYRRLLRLAFVQPAPALRGGPGLRLYEPDAAGGRLEGWLRLNAAAGGAPSMAEVHLRFDGEAPLPEPVEAAQPPAAPAPAPRPVAGSTATNVPAPIPTPSPATPAREAARLDERRLPGRDGSVQYLDGGRLGVLIRMLRVAPAALGVAPKPGGSPPPPKRPLPPQTPATGPSRGNAAPPRSGG